MTAAGKIDWIAGLLLICILLMPLTKMIPFLPSVPDMVYYAGFVGIVFWGLLHGAISVSYAYLPFMAVMFISVWVNDIPAFFRVWFRLIAFLALFLAVGPFWVNPMMATWRRLLFTYLLMVIRLIVIVSFLGWAGGLGFVYGYSGFQGLTSQSMILGPLGGISLIYGLYRFYLSSKRTGRYKEIGMVIISGIVLLLAGSRAALGSTALAAAFFYSRIYHHRMTRLLQLIFLFICMAVLTSGIWWPYTERLRSKMEGGKIAGSMTASRDNLWKDRVNEFKAFPIFGVGFATVNLEYVQTKEKVNQQNGGIEPGSGWLFILSSMGLVGFLSFFVPYVHTLYRLYKRDEKEINGYFVGTLLFFFFFHLYFEGYPLASGSFFCFLLWLLLSECNKIINTNN